jgi:hypothetical protein
MNIPTTTEPTQVNNDSGRNERRSEIKIIIVMPPGVAQSTPGMHKWTEEFMVEIAEDLKHTRSWRCEQCGMVHPPSI